jgi:hypothetical protein
MPLSQKNSIDMDRILSDGKEKGEVDANSGCGKLKGSRGEIDGNPEKWGNVNKENV